MEKLDADNWQDLIQSIKSKGMRPGVSLRPGTPVEEVFPLVTSSTHYTLWIIMLYTEKKPIILGLSNGVLFPHS